MRIRKIVKSIIIFCFLFLRHICFGDGILKSFPIFCLLFLCHQFLQNKNDKFIKIIREAVYIHFSYRVNIYEHLSTLQKVYLPSSKCMLLTAPTVTQIVISFMINCSKNLILYPQLENTWFSETLMQKLENPLSTGLQWPVNAVLVI